MIASDDAADPTTTTGNLTVSCTGSFDTSSSLQVSLAVQAAQPSCSPPASSSASATISFLCCVTATPSSPAFAIFNTAARCHSCGNSAIPYTISPGGTSATTGRLMSNLGSTCDSGGFPPRNSGISTQSNVTLTCLSDALLSFSFMAPPFSKLSRSSVSYLIRCLPANVRKCPVFTAVSSLAPASRYSIREVNTTNGSYSLTWKVPMSSLGCTCTSTAVAVRATGTFVGGCNQVSKGSRGPRKGQPGR